MWLAFYDEQAGYPSGGPVMGQVFFPTSRAAHHGGNSLVWLQKISHRVNRRKCGPPSSGVRGLPVVEAIAIYSDAGARWCLFRMFM
jgi:hypothetical protein